MLELTYEKKITDKTSRTITTGAGRMLLYEAIWELESEIPAIFSYSTGLGPHEVIDHLRYYKLNFNTGYRSILLGTFNHNLHLTAEICTSAHFFPMMFTRYIIQAERL